MKSLTTIKKIKSFLILGRWLSPLSNDKKLPRVSSTLFELKVNGRNKKEKTIKIHIFEPLNKKISGVILVAPGLHPLGPKDPRFIRLNSVLAASGNLVFSPSIDDYTSMKITEESLKDFTECFKMILTHPKRPQDKKITVFSISLGSLLALKLASNKTMNQNINSIIIYGGYGNWNSMCSDIIQKSTKQDKGYDIRNIPAIFKHLTDALIPTEDTQQSQILDHCWEEYIKTTWTDEKYKNIDSCKELAHRISKKLEEPYKDIFYLGCGLKKNYDTVFFESIKKLNLMHLDPLANIDDLNCRTYLIHGKDDELISIKEQSVIKKALPKHIQVSSYSTGFYKHSKCETPLGTLKNIEQTHQELKTAIKILWALSSAPITPA